MIVMTSDNLTGIFRDNLRHALDERGVSQADLARRLGCSSAYVNKILHGKYDPGLGVIERVAESLGMKAFELLIPIEEKIPA